MIRYFEGDAIQAREALGKVTASVENPDPEIQIYRLGQAQYLRIQYARLFVLERWLGNEAAADAALTKVQYWRTRCYELLEMEGPLSPTFQEERRTFTPEGLVRTIESLDRSNTQGKGPKYRRKA